MFDAAKIIDGHVHLLGGSDAIEKLEDVRRRLGVGRMCIASLYSPETINENPDAFMAKSLHPENYYVFAGLDHSAHFSSGTIATPSLAEQVEQLREMGADGIKLLETKPDRRKAMGIAIDSDYFASMFAKAEELGMPLLWHVADPPEFWDAKLTPRWAAEQGWGYDETFVPWEQLYAEVENVLKRHPKLRVIFPHFFFLSGDLKRAAELFERYENIHFDLAPGIELLYNLSKDTQTAREFFVKHSTRIIYGTDIYMEPTVAELLIRAAVVRRWLETEDEFRLPDGADFLLGPPEDGVIRGLHLSEDVLTSIYHANFERIVGSVPRKLHIS